MRILSWNTNSLRSVLAKGHLDFIRKEQVDVICLQEIKMDRDLIPIKEYSEFHQYYSLAEKKGYSGVATWCREEPKEIEYGLGIERFDREGRTLITHFGDLVLFNVYFPNGKKGPDRLQYKLDFYEAFLEKIVEYRKKMKVVFCGDVNTAHNEIDIARPRENSHISGFLRIEREWMDKLEEKGWIDTFRAIHPHEVAYSWWDYKTGARKRNVGWRIDYFYIDSEMRERLKDAFILNEIMGSDHCPVGIDLR